MVLARDVNRLVRSLAMFLSFFLLGVFVSALGPAVPALSRDIGAQEVSFGLVFSFRGLGHLLGSWSSSFRLPAMGLKPRLQQALNNRMNRLGAATTGLGLFSVALVAAGTLWLVCAWCFCQFRLRTDVLWLFSIALVATGPSWLVCAGRFCQGFCGGAIDAIANAAISDVHGTGAAPWLQGLHFCFSIGALVAPAAVGQLGYRAVFVAFGLLAMPASLVCYVDDDGDESSRSGGWPLREGGQGMMLQEESDGTMYSTDSIASFESNADIMEAARRGSDGNAVYEEVQALQQQEERTDISPPIGILPGKEITAHGEGGQHAKPLDAAPTAAAAAAAAVAAPTLDEMSQAQQLGEGKGTGAAHMLSGTSRPRENKKTARDLVAEQQVGKSDKTTLLPQKGAEGNLPPFSLIALLSFFLFLYVGAEVGFGAWVAVAVLRDGLSGEAGAVRMASLFWGGITVGRLLAVPLAVRFSNAFLIRANLLGGLLSSVLLLLAGRVNYAWAAVGVGLFGLSMASTFPLAISLLPSAGFFLSGQSSSRMVIGGALGDMLMPSLIAALMGSEDGVWPAALYIVCVVVSVLMLLAYGACCILLKRAGQRGVEGEGRL